jgi:hypothetical protein
VVWRGEVVVNWEVRRGTGKLLTFVSGIIGLSGAREVRIDLRLKNCASANNLTKCDPSRGSI